MVALKTHEMVKSHRFTKYIENLHFIMYNERKWGAKGSGALKESAALYQVQRNMKWSVKVSGTLEKSEHLRKRNKKGIGAFKRLCGKMSGANCEVKR